MQTIRFLAVLDEQIDRCKSILDKKSDEYATDTDRLHNFKVAAALQHCTPRQAVAGMMAKHTVSIYDMCESADDFSIEDWEEKITDHINYLILLKAVLFEEQDTNNDN